MGSKCIVYNYKSMSMVWTFCLTKQNPRSHSHSTRQPTSNKGELIILHTSSIYCALLCAHWSNKPNQPLLIMAKWPINSNVLLQLYPVRLVLLHGMPCFGRLVSGIPRAWLPMWHKRLILLRIQCGGTMPSWPCGNKRHDWFNVTFSQQPFCTTGSTYSTPACFALMKNSTGAKSSDDVLPTAVSQMTTRATATRMTINGHQQCPPITWGVPLVSL